MIPVLIRIATKTYLGIAGTIAFLLLFAPNWQWLLFLSNIRSLILLPGIIPGLFLVCRFPLSRWSVILLLSILALPWNLYRSPDYCLDKPRTDAPLMRLMTLNLAGSALDSGRDLLKISAILDLDLLALQEVTPKFWRTEKIQLEEHYPYWAYRESPEGYWTQALLTRFPIQSTGIKDPGPGFSNFDSRLVLDTEIQAGEQSFRFLTVHLSVPFYRGDCRGLFCLLTRYDQQQRDAQLRQLFRWSRESNKPTIIIGDLNLSDENPFYQEILGNGLLDSGRCSDSSNATWPMDQDWIPPFTRIDYIILSPLGSPGQPGLLLRSRTMKIPGSDHRAVISEVFLRE